MQSRELLQITRCPEPRFKLWVKNRVILPAREGGGRGNHADFDDANTLALTLAMLLHDAELVVQHYDKPFGEFQRWLRETASDGWMRYRLAMTKDRAYLCAADATLNSGEPMLLVDIGWLQKYRMAHGESEVRNSRTVTS